VEGPEFSRITPPFPVRKNFKWGLKANSYSKFTTAKIFKILVTVVPKLSEAPSIPKLRSRKKYITSPIYVSVKRM
jgi:hypothetical protein